jgi:colicin import membrane protein
LERENAQGERRLAAQQQRLELAAEVAESDKRRHETEVRERGREREHLKEVAQQSEARTAEAAAALARAKNQWRLERARLQEAADAAAEAVRHARAVGSDEEKERHRVEALLAASRAERTREREQLRKQLEFERERREEERRKERETAAAREAERDAARAGQSRARREAEEAREAAQAAEEAAAGLRAALKERSAESARRARSEEQLRRTNEALKVQALMLHRRLEEADAEADETSKFLAATADALAALCRDGALPGTTSAHVKELGRVLSAFDRDSGAGAESKTTFAEAVVNHLDAPWEGPLV